MNQKDILKAEFKKLLNILKENNKKYSLIAGSILGAVKFQGFIPWDDDIDITIDLDTYHFLLEKYPNNIICSNDDNYPLMFPKWVPDKNNIENSNIFIDLFVRVKTTKENIRKFRSFKNKIKYAVYSLSHNFYPFNVGLHILKFILKPFNAFVKKNLTLEEAHKLLHDKNGDREILIVNPVDSIKNCDISMLGDETISAKFEGINIYIPKKYQEYFTFKYGSINVDKTIKRKIEKHANAFNIMQGTWDGKVVKYSEEKFQKIIRKSQKK